MAGPLSHKKHHKDETTPKVIKRPEIDKKEVGPVDYGIERRCGRQDEMIHLC